jgi:hypothetical protein
LANRPWLRACWAARLQARRPRARDQDPARRRPEIGVEGSITPPSAPPCPCGPGVAGGGRSPRVAAARQASPGRRDRNRSTKPDTDPWQIAGGGRPGPWSTPCARAARRRASLPGSSSWWTWRSASRYAEGARRDGRPTPLGFGPHTRQRVRPQSGDQCHEIWGRVEYKVAKSVRKGEPVQKSARCNGPEGGQYPVQLARAGDGGGECYAAGCFS